ncbi:MAG TPA: hypothetical protein VND90_09570 [Terracidiphilus sp.]|nr:hypothetical protein [Terracidiphilus sp.]
MKDPIPFPKSGEPGNHAEEAVATLRAVASLPAREGLEKRLKVGLSHRLRAGLPAASEDEEFGARGWIHGTLMRGLAAAAIVLIVVGGGWGVARYGRRPATPRMIGIPRMAPPGEFSNSGAMRTPQTLTPPSVPKPRHDVRATDNRTRKAKAGKRKKPKASDERNGNAPNDGAPERK